MTSKEIYEKYQKAVKEYENSKSQLDIYPDHASDEFVHMMYLMGRMHALNELYESACLKEEFVHA